MKRTGELLKKAREEKRLSLHEVALFLKINSRVLQAIEDGDQAQLPARTFLRGFIQSYAKFLKLDAQVVLQLFAEETSPSDMSAPEAETLPPVVERPLSTEAKKEAEAQAEVDSASLEKSILTQSQVAQDKLGFKTIAVSVVGLVLVAILYFANSVVKKYQKEAQVDPVASIAESVEAEETPDAPAAEVIETEKSTAEVVAPNTESKAVTTTTAPPETAATAPKTPIPNSVQPNSSSSNTPFISPFNLSTQKIEAKPKPAEATAAPNEKPITSKPVTQPAEPLAGLPKPTETPVTKPAPSATPTPAPTVATVAPVTTPPSAAPEGKLVEVIVEANDAVEIEYSSSKTSPQKMFLKAEQIHIFKSRSGVRLKISNGGAVNIIMNGRDLGVPGATGQPVQVTY